MQTSIGNGPAAAWRLDLALFAISAAVLTLEVLQAKIFSYSLDPLTIYLAVGVCLLGLGASATLLAMAPPLEELRARRWAAASAAASAVAIPLAHAAFAAWARSLYEGGLLGIVTLIVLTVPYFFMGLTVALLLVARSAAIGRAYAFNLAGSGLGCLLVFPLLDHLGAERVVMAVAWMALAAALPLHIPRAGRLLGAWAVLLAILAVGTLRAPEWLSFPPDPRGQLAVVYARAAMLGQKIPGSRMNLRQVFQRWDRTGRVDVYDVETNVPSLRTRIGAPLDVKFFVQDASAGSILLGVGNDLERAAPFFEQTIYGAGYAPGPVEDVLIIGLGGAPDVLAALHHGAKHVTGVEINRATIDLIRDDFADFVGAPYRQPGVEIHQMDGRTFLRQTSERYDLIQMSGVDTKTLLASGSLSLSNNYLYTREAMNDLLSRLRPNGLLAITRFADAETHRLVGLALAGLRDLGRSEPPKHIITIQQGIWRSVLIKRTAFTESELERVHAWVANTDEPPDIVIPAYDLIGVTLRTPMKVIYSPPPRSVTRTPYYRALARGRLDAFVAAAKVDLSPPMDDRPYFFFRARPDRVFGDPPKVLTNLLRMAAQLGVVSAIFILVPLLAFRRRGLRTARAGRSLLYFTFLGAGFMLLEIGMIQRFVLLLGHQSHAITVVLFGLLAGAAMGSALSSRVGVATRMPLASVLIAIVLLVLAYAFGLRAILDADAVISLSFGGRLALALSLLVLLGFFLGIPFPVGLRAVRVSRVALVTWGIGVNAFASVIGSTLAVPIALVAGHRVLILLAACLYLLAVATAPVGDAGRKRAAT